MHGLEPGFERPVHDAQATFRGVLDAMSRPGEIRQLPKPLGHPVPMSPAMTSVLLTLADYDTPLWLTGFLDSEETRGYLAFHCGLPFVDEGQGGEARIVATRGTETLPPLTVLAQGTAEYPDRSATLIIDLDTFEPGGTKVRLSGPGIAGHRIIDSAALDQAFWRMAQQNAASYPLGIDFIFCADDLVMAMPRSTHIVFEADSNGD